MEKLIVLSAPSGAGKTSIVHYLLETIPSLSFSVSACNRAKRKNELHKKDYYFLDTSDFKKKIKENAFLEWEEVYPGQYYGTLKSELKRIWGNGKVVIFDVDVMGGLNIKKLYPKNCLAIFIAPPSIEALIERLQKRGTETKKNIKNRISKATEELQESKKFDKIVLNDHFDIACKSTSELITAFIKTKL